MTSCRPPLWVRDLLPSGIFGIQPWIYEIQILGLFAYAPQTQTQTQLEFRNESNKESWKWNGRVIEKFSKNILSKKEPDDSYEMSTFYQGASGVVLQGKIYVEKRL